MDFLSSTTSFYDVPLPWPPQLLHKHLRIPAPPLNSPFHWKASLRLSSTSANHRTSFTSCITYSGSTPGAPTRRDVSPMLLRGLGFLALRPMDPADRDPVWGLERCRGGPWVCLVPPPPLLLLLLLFRSIPAATPAATLYRRYGRPASPWTHHAALVPGWQKDRERWVKMMCVIQHLWVGDLLFRLIHLLYNWQLKDMLHVYSNHINQRTQSIYFKIK